MPERSEDEDFFFGEKVYHGQNAKKTCADVNPVLPEAEQRFWERIYTGREGSLQMDR